MPLPSFLRRKTPPPAAAPRPEKSAAGAPAVVAQARTRARRRLIGAVVLLGIGVIAFPLLFETEPRPIAVDLPIEIPKKDGVPPLAMPPAAPRSGRTGSAEPVPPVAETGTEPAPAPETKPAEKAAGKAVEKAVEMAADKTVDKTPTAASAPPRDNGARAKALLEGKSAAPVPDGRYVVQIGAFAEDRTVREARAKAQKAGLETYTQVVKVSAGEATRVRVGPFNSRKDADAAAAKVRQAGLPATVLKL